MNPTRTADTGGWQHLLSRHVRLALGDEKSRRDAFQWMEDAEDAVCRAYGITAGLEEARLWEIARAIEREEGDAFGVALDATDHWVHAQVMRLQES